MRSQFTLTALKGLNSTGSPRDLSSWIPAGTKAVYSYREKQGQASRPWQYPVTFQTKWCGLGRWKANTMPLSVYDLPSFTLPFKPLGENVLLSLEILNGAKTIGHLLFLARSLKKWTISPTVLDVMVGDSVHFVAKINEIDDKLCVMFSFHFIPS